MSFSRLTSFRRSQRRSGEHHDPNVQAQFSEEPEVMDPNQFGLLGNYSRSHRQTPSQDPAPEGSQLSSQEPGHSQHSHRHNLFSSGDAGWQSINASQHQANSQRVPATLQEEPYDPTHHADETESHSPLVNQSQASLNQDTSLSAPHSKISQAPSRKETNIFDVAHMGGDGKKKEHIMSHGADVPVRVGHLFKRPLVRQWIYAGKLYREADERAPSRFELFFDLAYVGIVHKLADSAAEEVSGLNIAKFLLAFYPSWSIWQDVRGYINQSGTDDVWQRLYILLIMIVLAGYAANATAVQIFNYPEALETALAALREGASASAAESAVEGDVGERALSAARSVAATAGSAALWLARQAAENAGEAAGAAGEAAGAAASEGAEAALEEQAMEIVNETVGHFITKDFYFGKGYETALKAALAFYLVAKLARLLLYFVYALLLPKFRRSLLVAATGLVVIAAVYIPLLFLHDPKIIIALLVAGIGVEYIIRYVLMALMQWMHGHLKHDGQHIFIPAISIEHLMERIVLFVVLITGESILNSTVTATQADGYGLTEQYGRSALGICIAFFLIWIYFDADASRTYVHALRRHWFTSLTFSLVHYPLCAGLILMSAALSPMMKGGEIKHGYFWYFGGSTATVMGCIGILGLLHKSLDVHHSALRPHALRIAVRFAVAIVFALLPLRSHWSAVHFLGTYAAILACVVFSETFGKLGSLGRHYDPVRAAELRKRNRENSEALRHGEVEVGPSGSSTSIPLNEVRSGETHQHEKGRRPDDHHLDYVQRRRFGKDELTPPRRASWHEWEDLTGDERGEEDVGIESELGKLEVKELSNSARWAYAA